MINSKSLKVWDRTLSSALASVRARLNVGSTTVTAGGKLTIDLRGAGTTVHYHAIYCVRKISVKYTVPFDETHTPIAVLL